MLNKVRHFREEMTRIQQSLKPLAEVSSSGFGPADFDSTDMSPEDRMSHQVMMGRQALDRTGQRIARSQQVNKSKNILCGVHVYHFSSHNFP